MLAVQRHVHLPVSFTGLMAGFVFCHIFSSVRYGIVSEYSSFGTITWSSRAQVRWIERCSARTRVGKIGVWWKACPISLLIWWHMVGVARMVGWHVVRIAIGHHMGRRVSLEIGSRVRGFSFSFIVQWHLSLIRWVCRFFPSLSMSW